MGKNKKNENSLNEYVAKLRSMIEKRKGAYDDFLDPQLLITAKCWRMLDKMDEEIYEMPLTDVEIGSQGQQRTVVNPLLAQYDKMQRTLKMHFSALGLTYDIIPDKVNNAKGDEETDSASDKELVGFFRNMQ